MKKTLTLILVLLALAFSILLYSRFLGTKGLKTNEITLKANIPESYDGLKVVHFADLHYKKVITEKRVTELIKEINQLKPDLVLFTGDLLDQDYTPTNTDINFLIKTFSKIETKYGAFAILGDQDTAMKETINNIYIQSNFTLLENNTTIIQNEKNEKILIGGLASYLNNKADITETINTISSQENVTYKIILIHEPDYIPTILEKLPNTSLILSAHSINGSINIPFIKQLLLPTGAKKYYKPYYKINNTDVYISNGIGVNRVNFRFLNTPSINFYRLQKQ